MSEPIDRRSFLMGGAKVAAFGALAASSGGLLAACGSSGSKSAGNAKPPSGRPRPGGNLRVGVWTEETSLLPLTTAWDGVGYSYGEAFFDQLMAIDVAGKVVPYLAESVTHSDDYTQWTIKVRPNVKFHDGSALDGGVLVANLKAAQASPIVGYVFEPVAKVEQSGPLSVTLTMKQPWVAFDAYLVGFFPQAAAVVAPGYRGNPIGTGPFVFKEWQPGNHLHVTKNPSYWRPGLPYLDQVSFLPILDSQQKENSLRAGDIDVALVGATIDDIRSLRADTSLQYVDGARAKVIESSMIYWMLNCAVAPTDDVRIRNAMAYAIDQKVFWDQVFVGAGSAAGPGTDVQVTGPFQPGSPYYERDTGYPQKQDMEKAKALVAAYTAEKGKPKVTVTASNERKELVALQLTQSMWQEAGIDVTVQQLDVGTLIVRGLQGQLQATFWDFGSVIDPDQNYPAWSPKFTAPVGTIALEVTRLQDSRIQPLLDTGRTNPDPDKRIAAYKQLARVFGELTPFIYLGREVGGYAAHKRVGNLTTLRSPDGNPLSWAQSGMVATEIWLG